MKVLMFILPLASRESSWSVQKNSFAASFFYLNLCILFPFFVVVIVDFSVTWMILIKPTTESRIDNLNKQQKKTKQKNKKKEEKRRQR